MHLHASRMEHGHAHSPCDRADPADRAATEECPCSSLGKRKIAPIRTRSAHVLGISILHLVDRSPRPGVFKHNAESSQIAQFRPTVGRARHVIGRRRLQVARGWSSLPNSAQHRSKPGQIWPKSAKCGRSQPTAAAKPAWDRAPSRIGGVPTSGAPTNPSMIAQESVQQLPVTCWRFAMHPQSIGRYEGGVGARAMLP